MRCSVVIPSRGRPEYLKKCIAWANKLANQPDEVEYVVRIDEDDTETIKMFQKDSFFQTLDNLKVYIGPRVGYQNLWRLFKRLIELSTGDIIFPLSDDLHIKSKGWDDKFYQYKDKNVIAGCFARIVLTRKAIKEHEYIRNWTGNTIRAGENIWRYARDRGFYIQRSNWFHKVDRTPTNEFYDRWELEDESLLEKPWKLLKIPEFIYIYHKEVLRDLIKAENLKVICEVGVWKSHLLRYLLRDKDCFKIITNYFAIDQFKPLAKEHGHMSNKTSYDWHLLYLNACKYMPWFPQLKIMKLTSYESSKLFQDEYFDLVFIDASHFYEDVLDDIKIWIPKVKKGGFISGHDYGMGEKKGHGVKQAVDEYFGEGNVIVKEDGVWYKKIEDER
jgi:hypothetical protein